MIGWALALMMVDAPAAAEPKDPEETNSGPRVELTASAGGMMYLGRRAVSMQVSGELGARVEFGFWAVHSRVGVGRGLAPKVNVNLALGADVFLPRKVWRPALGLELGLLIGRPLRVVDSEDGSTPHRAALLGSLQVRVQPLVFRIRRVSLSALALSGGIGFGRGDWVFGAQAFEVRVDLGRKSP